MKAADELAGRAARGFAWALASTVGAKLLWLGGLAILARVLAPEDFGLLAFGLVYVAYLESIGDLGTGAALVYWPGRDAGGLERTAQATFVVNLATGALFFALTQLVAPSVAAFFHEPEGEPILRALAWAFPLKALGNTHDALCQRELRFRARAVPELLLALAKTAAAVALALGGLGVWSLVWGQLLGLAAWVVGLWWVVPWRPAAGWPGERLRGVLRYGRGIVAVNVLAAVVHHADLVVVGRMLGTAALGFYQLAYKLPEMTVTVAIWVVGKVLFPTLSRLHAAGGDVGAGLLGALRYVPALTLPAAVGLAFVAEPAILTLYGGRWRPAIPLLQALALYLGVRSIGSPAGDLLKATGRSGLLAGLAAVKAAVLLPALVLAGRASVDAVAWTLAAVGVATTALNLAVAARLAPVRWAAIGRALAPAVLATVAMAAVLALSERVLGSGGEARGVAGLLLQVAAGAAVYLAALRLAAPDLLARAAASLRRTAAGPALGAEGR